MSKEQSQFIEVESVDDNFYIDIFGMGVNRKILKINFFNQFLAWISGYFPFTVQTRVNLFALEASIGTVIETKGCNSVGDGGHGTFDIVESPPYSADGYSVIQCANGFYAVLRLPYNVLQFGAIGDANSYCHAAFVRAFSVLSYSKSIFIPSGVYRIETSVTRSTPYTSGKSCFEFNSVSDFKIYGDGKFLSTIYFDPVDTFSARLFDFNTCDKIIIQGIGMVGANVPVNDPPSGTDGYMDRAINVVKTDGSRFEDLYVKNISRYGMAFQRGPYTNNIWNDIVFENIGNDCIDMKSYNLSAVYEQDINYNNHWENITAIAWGILSFEAPNQLLDMRSSYSTARNIVGMSPGNNTYLIRNVSGIGCSIYDPVCYSTNNTIGAAQNGILVCAPDTKIYNPKLFGCYKGIECAFNTEDGRQPWFDCQNPVIDGCFIGIDSTDFTGSKVYGGTIKNCAFRGVRVGYRTIIFGVTFNNCVIPIRLELTASGSMIISCNDTSGGTIASASAAVSQVNSLINCGAMATAYKMDFVGRELLIDGSKVLTIRQAAIPNAVGGTEVATINAILTAMRTHGLISP